MNLVCAAACIASGKSAPFKAQTFLFLRVTFHCNARNIISFALEAASILTAADSLALCMRRSPYKAQLRPKVPQTVRFEKSLFHRRIRHEKGGHDFFSQRLSKVLEKAAGFSLCAWDDHLSTPAHHMGGFVSRTASLLVFQIRLPSRMAFATVFLHQLLSHCWRCAHSVQVMIPFDLKE